MFSVSTFGVWIDKNNKFTAYFYAFFMCTFFSGVPFCTFFTWKVLFVTQKELAALDKNLFINWINYVPYLICNNITDHRDVVVFLSMPMTQHIFYKTSFTIVRHAFSCPNLFIVYSTNSSTNKKEHLNSGCGDMCVCWWHI